MPNLFIICLEPIEQRYTEQWYHNIPKELNALVADNKPNDKAYARLRQFQSANGTALPQGWNIETVDGVTIEDTTTDGAFLDFAMTNAYKASQIQAVAKMFTEGKVKAGDHFLITDAWNFAVTSIRYMSELLEIPVTIHGIWHAGAYDPTDILGMKMDNTWAHEQERAWFYALDHSYYATDFHRKMFLKNLNIDEVHHHKTHTSGQPHSLVVEAIQDNFNNTERENIIVFPHRLNEDKQPEIFRDLIQYLPEGWEGIITQEKGYSKDEYYEMFSKAKLNFSCSLHENLGISVMEGSLCGALPIVPARASYNEMWDIDFRYPTEWTLSWDHYIDHKRELIGFIYRLIENYDTYKARLAENNKRIISDFMAADVMYDIILNGDS